MVDANAARQADDPVTLEIIWGKLQAAADEMGLMLARSSMSPVIYEVLDFACGVCDDKAQLVAQTNGITVFTGTFQGHIQTVIGKFGDRIRPGDIYMVNDPYTGGTHLSDVGIIKPIFVDGELLAFGIAVAHWTEIGGSVPGSLSPKATEIFHEGLRFPGLRIYREGERQDDLFDLIAANVRLPKMTLGDLNAEIAAVRIADKRIQEMCGKYGAETIRRSFAHLMAQSERVSRAAIAALPDGVYTAKDLIDGDGFTDEQIPVQIEVHIKGDTIAFDFTGTSAQRPGPLNCTRGALLSAVKTVFKALVDPQALSNEGWFRPIEITVPDGTVFSATYPQAVGWYFEMTGQISELVWMALAPLAPERFSVGSFMSLCATVFYGREPRTGDQFVLIEPHMGGWGASHDQDGTSVLIGTADGDTYNYSVELLEAKFPIRCNRYAMNVEAGTGKGRYRGGFGVVREYQMLAGDAHMYASLGRSIERPWGLAGGGNGSNNYVEVASNGDSWRGARVPATELAEGDRVSIVTGSGGGYGDAYLRPPEDVRDDVLDGLLSAEAARVDYGVIVSQDGKVDAAATEMLRRRV